MSSSPTIATPARFAGVAAAGIALLFTWGAESAAAGSFICQSAITSAQATSIMGVRAQVVAGGGGADDCGVNARGYNHIIVTGYVVKRSFFDRVRRTTRTGKRTDDDGTITEYRQRTLKGFGGPAFSIETKSWYEGQSKPAITRSVFVHRHGRMLRPTTPGFGSEKIASIGQLVRLARVANRRL